MNLQQLCGLRVEPTPNTVYKQRRMSHPDIVLSLLGGSESLEGGCGLHTNQCQFREEPREFKFVLWGKFKNSETLSWGKGELSEEAELSITVIYWGSSVS